MIRFPPGYWTFERCAKEAAKYDRRKDFEIGANSARKAAVKNGWMDDICTHMTPGRNPHGYWNWQRCAGEALLYDTRADFQKWSMAAYSAARKSGWLDGICVHMLKTVLAEHETAVAKETGGHRGSKWTKEDCANSAIRYRSRGEFQQKDGRLYSLASRQGWLDEVCSHMIKPPRDGFYMIRERYPENFDYLVKFGHTTFDMGDYRVKQSARHFHKPVVVSFIQHAKAKRIERHLLKTFHRRPSMPNRAITGHTELRLLTDSELVEASEIVRSAFR